MHPLPYHLGNVFENQGQECVESGHGDPEINGSGGLPGQLSLPQGGGHAQAPLSRSTSGAAWRGRWETIACFQLRQGGGGKQAGAGPT